VPVSQDKPWIFFRRPNPRARLRLFCFPYAGGGASIYRQWGESLAAVDVEVLPVQLPGRESRLMEKPFVRFQPLVDTLIQALSPFMDQPFAFFGHSLGAVIGFELAHQLRIESRQEPLALLVSGRRAPHVPDDDPPMYDLPEAEFKAKLRELDGTPEAVLENPELMALMLPLLRADFELIETYAARERPPLAMPVLAYGGLEDPDVERQHMEAWQVVSQAQFNLRMFPGDHFFLHPQRDDLLAAVAADLARVMPAQ